MGDQQPLKVPRSCTYAGDFLLIGCVHLCCARVGTAACDKSCLREGTFDKIDGTVSTSLSHRCVAAPRWP
jgi:hypothetical protein